MIKRSQAIVILFKAFGMTVTLLLGISCSLMIGACTKLQVLSAHTGNKYQYNYTMTSPVVDGNLVYRDSTIYVQFRFDDSALRFQLQNITSSRVEINWSKVSVGVRGKVYNVRNSATLYSSAVSSAPATVLAPLGYFTDFVIPEKNISTDGTYRELDLLPTTDNNSPEEKQKILQSVGTTISFLLPLHVGSVTKEYNFKFTVANVQQIPWDKVKTPKRPAKPIKTQELYSTDQYVTAGIVVLVVGVASILLTQKKSPPSE